MGPCILIVSQKDGRECDAVIDFLRSHQADVVRVNLCDFPEDSTLSVSYPDLADCLYVDSAKAKRLRDCSAGWIHRLPPLSTSDTLRGLNREISIRESESLITGLLLSLECQWVNSPQNIWRSSHKPYQLTLACEQGLSIPPTLISNDQARVRDFVRDCDGPVVMKNLHSGYVEFEGRAYKAYTRVLSRDQLADLSNLSYGPCIFQACVDKARDLRLTFVDGEVFSASIRCDDLPPDDVDIRTLDFDVHRSRFTVTPVDDRLSSICSRMASALGLRYVGFDFVESRAGDLLFLEANALGAFMWIEQITGQPIAEALGRCILHLAQH